MTDDLTPSAKPIPRRARFEILRRDNFTCRYCGRSAPEVTLSVDHVIPRVLGGGDDPSNLVTSCTDCNFGKASTSPDEHTVADVAADALRWARATEEAARLRREQDAAREMECAQFLVAWRNIAYDESFLADDWYISLGAFMDRGLTLPDLLRLLDIASKSRAPTNQMWRYFCGCCWRTLAQRDEVARRLIEDGQV